MCAIILPFYVHLPFWAINEPHTLDRQGHYDIGYANDVGPYQREKMILLIAS